MLDDARRGVNLGHQLVRGVAPLEPEPASERGGDWAVVAPMGASQAKRRADAKKHAASEEDAEGLFRDCDRGAVPALGQAYGVETIVDERLDRAPEIWLEAGDHERLVHLSGEQFHTLTAAARRGRFAHA